MLIGKDWSKSRSSQRGANYEEKECRFTSDPPEGNHMAIPISLKRLDALVEAGAFLHLVGVGPRRGLAEYWIAVALPSEGDKAYVVVSSNDVNIRTLRHIDGIMSLIGRYPQMHAALLPVSPSIETPEDIYKLGRDEILQRVSPCLGHGVAHSGNTVQIDRSHTICQ